MHQFFSGFASDRRRSESGQAGLVVLLMTVALLTIGVSIASRSTSDVSLSTQEEESNRTLNAAEAGVERGLSDLTNPNCSTTVDEKTVECSVSQVQRLETRLFEGVSAQVNLTGTALAPHLIIEWGKNTSCDDNPPAMLVSIFSVVGGNARMRTIGLNPYSCTMPSNNFTRAVSIASPYPYPWGYALPLVAGDQFVRIKPLYNDAYINIRPQTGHNLPTQYYKVRSRATNNNGEKNEERVVEVNRTLPVAPALFDYVLYSGVDLIK